MKITKKITLAGLSAACALTLVAGVFAINGGNGVANADNGANASASEPYFYSNLVDANNHEYALAKKFYKALEKINEDGDFLDGIVDYRLPEDTVTSDQLKGWVENGNLDVPKAFSAARDAFITDHPELFYINFYKMTISVAKSGNNYVGFINSGREANLYYENGLNTQAKVEEAIAAFNTRIDKIVGEMNKLAAEDTFTARDAYLAKEVNRYLAENITYDYVAYENKDDPNYVAAAYINTAYGGLVEGKAVCGGYSTSYKVIMDKLGIPCISVNGYTKNKDQNGKNAASNVYHMWNYVWLETPSSSTAHTYSARTTTDGAWYSVDVTWDYSATNKYRYALMSAGTDAEIHVNDGVISSSGYELKYPELSPFNYGSTGETDGLQASVEYTPDGETDDFGNPRQQMFVSVSYNGKSAKKLFEEDNLYLAFRNAEYTKNSQTGEMELKWTSWASLEIFRQFSVELFGTQDKLIDDNGFQTRYYDNTSIYYTQFAVFDVKPDRCVPNDWQFEIPNYDPETQSYYFFYFSNDLLNNTNAIQTSDVLINQSYGTYTPPPYILTGNQEVLIMSDSMRDNKITDKVVCAENKAFVFEISYDEPLHILNPNEPIGISFVSEHPNTQDYALFFPINSKGDLVELVEGYENSGSTKKIFNTLRFKFGPSLLYEHNEENYHFVFTNVGSAKLIPVFGNGLENDPTEYVTSDKLPNPAYYTFGRSVIACPARFNYDGRLWIECCAQPTLVTQTDLSAMDFKDEDGNSTFSENERSQMMLVAERANDETVDTMVDEITSGIGADLGIEKSKTETYDIKLQMCNKYPTISDGSYVKIALGFPEGYGPEDEGVTFKLFHRKHVVHDDGTDEYIIEQVPCVVTQFGIVATVTSFSPYMVAVVDADKATDRTIYASIEGKGGTLTKEDGKIRTVKEGESYTYTIQPNAGYKVYSVNLNGKNVMDKIVNGKLTVNYADLGTNNELVIQYIAAEAADRIQQKLNSNVIDQQVEVGKSVIGVDGQVSASTSMPTQNVAPEDFIQVDVPAGNNGNTNTNSTAIVIAVICVAAAAAVAVTIFIIVLQKKK